MLLKKNIGFWGAIFVCLLCFTACEKRADNPNRHLSLEYYQTLSDDIYALNSHRIRACIDSLIRLDQDSMTPDYRTRGYYNERNPFLWITRHGVDERVDTLLAYLRTVSDMGFSQKKFRVKQIEDDLIRIRQLKVDSKDDNRINDVMARLEYNLTKAYLRYTSGQRFGFVNPSYVFNQLDKIDGTDRFRTLYGDKSEASNREFYDSILHKVTVDSVKEVLREIQPANPFYKDLMSRLQKPNITAEQRRLLLVNMERSRWRLSDYPYLHTKYVIVNIPALSLFAVDGDKVQQMKVVVGALKTKTPLLHSNFTRMDINPQWLIPMSILKSSVARFAGNTSYFNRHHYFIRNRSTGKVVPTNQVTSAMILSGNYVVVQEGGPYNSLGRIIFRFNNDYSIYLHDTNSRGVFRKEDRCLSHGCVRVENPFDLAVFMLDNNKSVIGRIKYSMTVDSVTGPDKNKLIHSMKLMQDIPVFIVYYTLYPNRQGELEQYQDVYGYDQIIYKHLKNYMF